MQDAGFAAAAMTRAANRDLEAESSSDRMSMGAAGVEEGGGGRGWAEEGGAQRVGR